MYARGLDVVKDETKAVELLGQAADHGDARAQGQLGCMYDDGGGVIKLDVSYAKGQGVAKDDARAMQCFQKAAEGGSVEACIALGKMCADGLGLY